MGIGMPLSYPKTVLFFVNWRKLSLQSRTGTPVLPIEKNGNHLSSEAVRKLYQQGRLKEALQVLNLMEQPLDCFIYASFLHVCIKRKAFTEAKSVHSHMDEMGVIPDNVLGNILINMYGKCGSVENARQVFDEMPERDVQSWSSIIATYCRHGFPQQALELFNQMSISGVEPNEFTFASALSACAKLAALQQGIEIHKHIIRGGFHCDIFVQSCLVDMYAKCGNVENARQVFDKMHQRDVVSWNSMIAGYAQSGNVQDAVDLFEKMPERDGISWNAMIAVYMQNGYVNEALEVFNKMPKRNVVSWNSMVAGLTQNENLDEAFDLFRRMPNPDVISWNTIITGYSSIGQVDEAFKLFQQMPKPNVISWTALIAGYAQNGRSAEALKHFQEMQKAVVKADSKTLASVLPACANLAALEQGMEIHEEIIRRGFQSVVLMQNALVNMYAKCGSIEKARHLFDKMCYRDVVSWNAIIAGYAMHGRGKEALELFEQLQQSGINPNHITFLCVLSACCHVGLVEEGQKYFDSMNQQYHITPIMEHYVCMVDLLGRSGRLKEAHDFINKMPIQPDATLWGCLLGVSRVHNNIELAEYAAEHLIDLDPGNASPYVLLSNTYAASGMWHAARNVRIIMKERRVKKTPGCSWIVVNKQVHAFLMGDM